MPICLHKLKKNCQKPFHLLLFHKQDREQFGSESEHWLQVVRIIVWPTCTRTENVRGMITPLAIDWSANNTSPIQNVWFVKASEFTRNHYVDDESIAASGVFDCSSLDVCRTNPTPKNLTGVIWKLRLASGNEIHMGVFALLLCVSWLMKMIQTRTPRWKLIETSAGLSNAWSWRSGMIKGDSRSDSRLHFWNGFDFTYKAQSHIPLPDVL